MKIGVCMVANAVVYHRHAGDGRRRAWSALAFLGAFSLIALTLVWQLAPAGGGGARARAGLLAACAASAVGTVAAFQVLVP
jgi:hypothetical protein